MVVEPADSLGAGGCVVRMALGDHGIARVEFARAGGRGGGLAMVARKLRRFARHPAMDRDDDVDACDISLVRLRLLVHPAAASSAKYDLPPVARWLGRLMENLQHRRRHVRRGAYSKSHSRSRYISVGNCFHAIIRSPPQRSRAGRDAGAAFRHALRGDAGRPQRPVPRWPGILGPTASPFIARFLSDAAAPLQGLVTTHRAPENQPLPP